MKQSIIFSSFLVLLCTCGLDAKAEVTDATNQTTSAMHIDSFKVKGSDASKYYIANETAIFDLEIYFVAGSTPVEQRIAADNEIIESGLDNEDLLVFKAKSVEQIIAADNQVIEANIPPLAPLQIVEVVTPTAICTPAPKSKM